MKLTKTIFLTAIFVASLLIGSAANAQDAATNAPSDTSTNSFRPHVAPHALPDTARMLNLTPDQKTKVDPILEAERDKVAVINQDTTLSPEDRRAKIMQIRDNTTAQLKPILSQDQFLKWQRMRSLLHRMAPIAPPPAPVPGGISSTN